MLGAVTTGDTLEVLGSSRRTTGHVPRAEGRRNGESQPREKALGRKAARRSGHATRILSSASLQPQTRHGQQTSGVRRSLFGPWTAQVVGKRSRG